MADFGFWVVAGGLLVAVAALMLRALSRPLDTEAAHPDLKVYRDQLAEVDRDLARGVIGADDAARLRTEVSRRLLEADRALRGAGSGKTLPLLPVAAVGVGLLAGAVEGRPGMAMRVPATNSLGSLMLLSCRSRLVDVPNRSANSDTVSPFFTV